MLVTRDRLYERVWAPPMLAIAKDDEVSANCLVRVCASLNVLWPPRGYRAKAALGRRSLRVCAAHGGLYMAADVVFALRTAVVHRGAAPSKTEAEEVLGLARNVIEHLSTLPIR